MRSDPTLPRPIKRREHLFRTLCTFWIFPSFGAVWLIFADRSPWRHGLTGMERLQAVTLEQWVALLILLAHLVFLWLARHYDRTEVPRLPVPNPEDGTLL